MISIMWTYIAQEPAVIQRLLDSDQGKILAQTLGRNLDGVYFVAHGSSYNAAVAVSDFLSRTAGVRVNVFTPANFQYNASSLNLENRERTLVAAISQTGTSSGVIDAMRYAASLGFRTLGITDTADSPIAREASYTLLLGCGEEDSNAKTKGYTATLTALMLLSAELGVVRGTLDEDGRLQIRRELTAQAAELDKTAQRVLQWCREQDFGATVKDLYVLGYGMNFGTAMEGQLKLMETMCIPTMFNDIGEFSHGMHRSITEESTLLLLCTEHPLKKLTVDTFRYLQSIGANVILLDGANAVGEEPQSIPVTPYPLTQSLLLMTLAVQVLSVFGPERLGDDPNRDAHNDFTQVVHTRV